MARGVQLYPCPRVVTVEQNTIVRNGKAGIQFANATADSTAVNNLVALNGDTGIRSASLTGTNNRAFNNLVWSNRSTSNLSGISMWGNMTVSPKFLGSTDFRLTTDSPAIDVADPSWTEPFDVTGKSRTLGRGPDLGSYEIR